MDVAVYLAKAIICFAGACHPALVGVDTPAGSYPLQHRVVISDGYGGDVLQFDEDETSWLAVHRTYRNLPSRVKALRGPTAGRRHVSDGCINVAPDVYDRLLECCIDGTLTIDY